MDEKTAKNVLEHWYLSGKDECENILAALRIGQLRISILDKALQYTDGGNVDSLLKALRTYQMKKNGTFDKISKEVGGAYDELRKSWKDENKLFKELYGEQPKNVEKFMNTCKEQGEKLRKHTKEKHGLLGFLGRSKSIESRKWLYRLLIKLEKEFNECKWKKEQEEKWKEEQKKAKKR